MTGYKEGYPGVYQILNKLNGKCYIGSGVNIGNRWSVHKNFLRNKVHHSSKLQRAWNKYKKKNFIFRVVEKCSIKELILREQHYIDLFDSYYNGYNEQPIARSALGVKHTRQFKEKLRRAQLIICKDPREIQSRSFRAKRQHRKKNLGRHTWKSDHSKKMSECASRTMKRLWKIPKFRRKMIRSLRRRNKLGIMSKKRKYGNK